MDRLTFYQPLRPKSGRGAWVDVRVSWPLHARNKLSKRGPLWVGQTVPNVTQRFRFHGRSLDVIKPRKLTLACICVDQYEEMFHSLVALSFRPKFASRLGQDEGAQAVGSGRVRQRGVNSVVASGLHFQAAFGVICSG
ncbi:MAG TPA: hypothetical protein PLL48_16545 [Novosphingobium sp.]|nr:hypothetical protein [Novosphingobium sp.]